MKPLAAIAAVVLLCAGIAAAVAVAGTATTGTVSVCATASTPAHTVAVDGTPVSTVPGDTAAQCATTTYTVPTETVTTTVAGTTTAATTTAPATTTTASAPTYDSEIAYTQNRPAFTPTQTVNVSSASALKTAIANLQPGELVRASAPFTVSSGGTADALVIKNKLTSPAEIDLTGVTIDYTGGSNYDGVWLNAQNVWIFGGDVSTSDTGGDCIKVNGANGVIWWGFNLHDCGASGFGVLNTSPVNHLDVQGTITKVGQNLKWDPHTDKGTGLHGAILWDSGTTNVFTNNRFAFDVHDTQVGACVELGNSAVASAGGNTFYARCVTNPCKATTQTCGNGLEFWGDTTSLGLDVKYLEVDNYAGYAIETALSSGQNLDGVTVEYGRASNDMTNPYPAGRPLWDNTHGVVYQDVLPAP